jgi:anti-sigma-K factor RskA
MDYARPALADALAAQYAAGLLRGPARRRFERLLAAHPALRDAVQAWHERLMPLTAPLPAEPPPARVWRGIEQRLWPAPAAAPWWQRLGLWRGFAGAASAAALALLVLTLQPPAPQAPVVVVLQATQPGPYAGSSFVASLSADGRALVTRPVQPVAVQPDRALELWALPPQGAPRSLGLISAAGATVVERGRLPRSLLKGDTTGFAVSVEPPGGSPTGQPTGAIVYAGKLQL